MSSDDEVVRPRKPQPTAGSDDDEEVVRRPTAKKTVTKKVDSDSSDEEVVVKRPRPKADANRRAPSDDDEDVVRRPTKPHAQKDEDSTANLVDLIDYDAMNPDQFADLLKKVSKRKRLAEKLRIREIRADEEERKRQVADEGHLDGSKGHTYSTMLERILAVCRENNPDLSSSERAKLPMPKVERSGAKKTALTNFKELCNAMNRSQEDVKDFIEKQLTTTSSVDSNDCLIIRIQNLKSTAFENILQKYIMEYVRCTACNKIDTDLTRDATTRMQILSCRHCHATRYLQAVGAATFQAQTTKRARQRERML